MKWLFALIDRTFILPSDDDFERARKRSIVIVRSISFPAVLMYVVVFWQEGLFATAAVAFAYFILQGINTYLSLRSKRIMGSMIFTVTILLGAASAGQITLGGFVQSGGISMIAIIPSMSALLGLGQRAGLRTFGLFILMEIVLLIFDPLIRSNAPQVSDSFGLKIILINIFLVALIVFMMSAVMVNELEEARLRADNLLQNILPIHIAKQLKQRPENIADRFEEVTVLFADIVDFTKLSANADPHEVVRLLNEIFSELDTLALKHGLEKIKTIGDAYMVAGGLPLPRYDHAEAVAAFAVEVLQVLQTRRAWNDQPIHIRIGINTGTVVAGVIGRHKFIYDLWGDAVNTASRMESHGVGNTIQVTQSTYERLKHLYEFESRGVMNIKGKGEMNAYLLRERKAPPALI